MAQSFASVAWRAEDVKEMRPLWDDAQCNNWLSANSKYIQEAMVKSGYDAIESLLPEEDE